jgi:hypothetical protein
MPRSSAISWLDSPRTSTGPRKGTILSVLFDPDDHSKVLVDDSESGAVETGDRQTSWPVPRWPAIRRSAPPWKISCAAVADPAGFQKRMREQAGANPLIAGLGGAAQAPQDPLDQLERLADLRDRGVLTDDEFEAEKRRIMAENA